MKIIEAMKRVKLNKQKIGDLQNKIALNCANLNFETPLYGSEQSAKVSEWLQSASDLTLENVRLLTAIARTNLATSVTITFSEGKSVTKSIAEWVWRRREYAALDQLTWNQLTDRNLKEGTGKNSQGADVEVKITRHFSPQVRDARLEEFRMEPHLIDASLEVVNAVTDLLES